MNKTFSINISGVIFHINDDAYELLNQYLRDLKQHFQKMDESDEIISDIESRMAEIFSENASGANVIISMHEVQKVIEILGQVEDLDDSEDLYEEESSSKAKKSKYKVDNKKKRKLYRDADDNMLAGVAKGLAWYFGIDATLVRVIFIILALSGTAGIWIYIILWAVTPEAKTSIEKLEMRGEPVNLSNLEKNIKDEFENVKETIKNNDLGNKIGTFFNRLFQLVSQVIKGILSFIKYIFGGIFLFTGIIFLSVITSFFLFDSNLVSVVNDQWVSFSVRDVMYFFTNIEQAKILLLSFVAVIGIPVIALIYSGIRIIFGFSIKSKALGIIIFILWVFSTIIFTVGLIDVAKEFKVKKTHSEQILIEKESKQLYLIVNDNSKDLDSDQIVFEDNSSDVILTHDHVYMKTEVEIWTSEDSLFRIKVNRRSLGRNKHEAIDNLDELEFNINHSNDTLFVDYYGMIGKKFRGQKVEIQIFKPKGAKIISNNKHFFGSDW